MSDFEYTTEYFERDGLYESIFHQEKVLRPDQASALLYAFMGNRWPTFVLSIGSGLGVLEAMFDHLRIPCVGLDGCGGLRGVYQGRHLINKRLCVALEENAHAIERADTLIFSESIEHIPMKQVKRTIALFTGRLIVTNRLCFHPIGKTNEHITPINDAVYDEFESAYGKAVFRCGSHLVIDVARTLI